MATNGQGNVRVEIIRKLNFYYGNFQALTNINVNLFDRKVTAFIGPSGCGKSTLLRVLNRIYQLYPNQRAEGQVIIDGENILKRGQDLNLLRAKIGMVFQKPTPFPMTIYDNIAFGIQLYERLPRGELADPHRGGAHPRRAVGRSEGQAAPERHESLRRPATAPVHRPLRRHQARSHPARRAVLGA